MVSKYPSPAQQTTFLSAYASHRPAFNPAPGTLSHRLSMTETPTSSHPSTPSMLPMSSSNQESSTLSMHSRLVLPAPATHPQGLGSVPLGDDDASVKWEVERLRLETRAWRGINSAQWVLWGIVQAKLPSDAKKESAPETTSESGKEVSESQTSDQKPSEEESVEEEDGFDYLAYTRERVAFFWGDVLALGIMTENELTPEIVDNARILDY
jgi:choline kinase